MTKGRKTRKQEPRPDLKHINTGARSWNTVRNFDVFISGLKLIPQRKICTNIQVMGRKKKKEEKTTNKQKTHTLCQPSFPSKLCIHEIKTNTVERKKIIVQYGKQ